MSVVTGRPVDCFTRARMARPSRRPGPRYASTLVRLALSNEALKTSGRESSSEICFRRAAIDSVSSVAFDDARAGNHQQRLPSAATVRSDGDRISSCSFLFGNDQREPARQDFDFHGQEAAGVAVQLIGHLVL